MRVLITGGAGLPGETLIAGETAPGDRVHRHRYHGVRAPNARLRERVVTLGRDDAPASGGIASHLDGEPREDGTAGDAEAADLPDSPHRAGARSRWARLPEPVPDFDFDQSTGA
jgi:hypothetical protein